MLTILVDKVKPGMKLAEALVNEEGQVLLPAGKLLAKEELAILSQAKEAYIKIESLASLGRRRPGREAHWQEELEERFSRVHLTPTLLKIKEALKASYR